MTLQQIKNRLQGRGGWYGATLDCQNAFASVMRERDYGGDALLDAWLWFYIGWTARSNAIENGRRESGL